ncbi:hypothetical protein SAMN05444274_10757 [Mariniphaga anaerophila]|uniref:Uncharacterized protein n=1 Tax=Mariniphaga anaerophila TaxID=1484053 RepID=A0A1M5DDU1_9BACT|nr:hypothetical protein [Mariniphaga anaerophila]SHF65096.1 hypothetical protein SAMN05444274_10757 [Mariniphaga anaerophila]
MPLLVREVAFFDSKKAREQHKQSRGNPEIAGGRINIADGLKKMAKGRGKCAAGIKKMAGGQQNYADGNEKMPGGRVRSAAGSLKSMGSRSLAAISKTHNLYGDIVCSNPTSASCASSANNHSKQNSSLTSTLFLYVCSQ